MAVKKLDLNLLESNKKIDISAKRRVLSNVIEGSWSAMLKGRGMEFAGFRKYTYGDDASSIDWGASLRSKDVLIREFEEYKSVTVFIVLDVSRSMLFASEGKTKAEYGAELAFNLASAIVENDNAVGFALFNDKIVESMQPSVGKDMLYRMAAALEKPENYGGEFSLQAAVNAVERTLKTRALIIIISDFIGLKDGWEQYVRMIGQKHDMISIVLRDPRDRHLPELPAQVLIEDPYTHERLYIDTKQYKEKYELEVRAQEEKLNGVFKKAQAGFLVMETGDDAMTPLIKYFRKRASYVKG